MSKELSPLEVSKQLKDFIFELELGNVDKLFVRGSFDIIETALKEYEKSQHIVGTTTIEDAFTQFLIKRCPDVEKRLKALKIIKEKGCLQFCMLGVSLKDYNQSVDNINLYEYGGISRYKHYTQEEFDLLKEVLL